MALTLSSAELRRLDDAANALVTPFAYPDMMSWGAEVIQRCVSFLGAHQAYFAVLRPNAMVGLGHGEYTEDGMASYKAYYGQRDFTVNERIRDRNLEVYHRDMLYRAGEIRHDEVYNDWSVPHKFCDTIGMALRQPELMAIMHFYHDTETGDFRDVGVDKLRLLLPAFKAGIAGWLSFSERREAIHALLENTADGVLLTDLSGRALHRTASLGRTLAEDPERERVLRILTEAATTLGTMVSRRRGKTDTEVHTLPRISRSVRTCRARYGIVASYLPEQVAAPFPITAAVLTRESRVELSSGELRVHFGLTARESQVARLLAAGRRNNDIASTLGISEHTALRHTERVLRKLGIHSRAAVASLITR